MAGKVSQFKKKKNGGHNYADFEKITVKNLLLKWCKTFRLQKKNGGKSFRI